MLQVYKNSTRLCGRGSFFRIPTRQFTNSCFRQNKNEQSKPDKSQEYGNFSKQEYENAKAILSEQITRLESEIKGETNIRSKIGTIPQFPSPSTSASHRVDNLTDFFAQTIQLTGPIPLSAYMRQCLTHPEMGYYTTRDPLSLRDGDFITSPEISSVFGEMVGIWYFTIWQSQGFPETIRFIEFGPGRGTLMYDLVKSFNKFVKKLGKKVNIEVLMIEASDVLRREQWKLLCDPEHEFKTTEEGYNTSTTKWGDSIKWVNTEKDIVNSDDIANYIIAHEFFDALPIKSFIKTEAGWRELMVEHTPTVTNTQPKLETSEEVVEDELLQTEFHLTTSPKETPSSMIPTLSPRYRDLPQGSRIEFCPDAELYLLKMIQLLKSNLGAVLIMDYGVVNSIPENSLRGIYKHKFVSPFIKPGEVDLSIDVDFDNLINIAQQIKQGNVINYGPVEQGDWLHNIGVGYRIDQLIKQNESNPEVQDKIYGAYKRLTDKDQMGGIYKFLTFMPKGSDKPIGF
ncbi:NADH dehydrogenase ubiquinone complex I assembly factor 7 [Spathaspora sp. JA1]|nr:NADH dehydrogenase ubiquinone complex I assembly factor 7 [Spathaspora sp. JA1]